MIRYHEINIINGKYLKIRFPVLNVVYIPLKNINLIEIYKDNNYVMFELQCNIEKIECDMKCKYNTSYFKHFSDHNDIRREIMNLEKIIEQV